ncbi:MAG: hypothetical protein ACRYFS_25575 [Janthinobacterium lividum]
MYQTLRQTYQHVVQQQIVHWEMSIGRRTHRQGMSWEIPSILALFSAAIACGTLAQIHLG